MTQTETPISDRIQFSIDDYPTWQSLETMQKSGVKLRALLTRSSEEGTKYNADFEIVYADGSRGILSTKFDFENRTFYGEGGFSPNSREPFKYVKELKDMEIKDDIYRVFHNSELIDYIASAIKVRLMIERADEMSRRKVE